MAKTQMENLLCHFALIPRHLNCVFLSLFRNGWSFTSWWITCTCTNLPKFMYLPSFVRWLFSSDVLLFLLFWITRLNNLKYHSALNSRSLNCLFLSFISGKTDVYTVMGPMSSDFNESVLFSCDYLWLHVFAFYL